MKYVISYGYDKYAYSFTTDLLFSIASFNLSHDGIPRTKQQINFLEKQEDGSLFETDYFPFPFYQGFTMELRDDTVYLDIHDRSDFRLLVEAIEKIGLEVKMKSYETE